MGKLLTKDQRYKIESLYNLDSNYKCTTFILDKKNVFELCTYTLKKTFQSTLSCKNELLLRN